MERNEVNIQNPISELIGFDWNVKAILGSSSLATIQLPLVGVDFYLGEPGKGIKDLKPDSVVENVSIEMTQTELKNLIAVLEKAVGSS